MASTPPVAELDPRFSADDAKPTEWDGGDWQFDVAGGRFVHDAGEALVYEVAPVVGFAFRKGEYSQTRWRFGGG